MENTQIDRDMFGHTVQSYENLKVRAKQVLEIRCEYFNIYYDEIEDLSILPDEVNMTCSWYRCGEYDFTYVSFPSFYLLMEDEELHSIFKKEIEDEKERERKKKNKEERKEKERHEEWERKQLVELIAKYGIPQGE